MLLGYFEQVLPPVYAEFAVYLAGKSVDSSGQYVQFLRYLGAAQAPHDTVRYLIFPAGKGFRGFFHQVFHALFMGRFFFRHGKFCHGEFCRGRFRLSGGSQQGRP